MRTKLVYVVTGSENDFYLDQAYVSMSSARYHMPDVQIALVTDKKTEATFVGRRAEQVGIADEIISIDVGESYSSKVVSRILKTNVRSYIEGDILFVDSDTLIVRPLDDIDEFTGQIGAVLDMHVRFSDHPSRSYIRFVESFARTNDFILQDSFFNSGVIYVKDTADTHRFYDRWYANFLLGLQKGVNVDQPSLAWTNSQIGLISELEGMWNCQLTKGVRFYNSMYILHYFATYHNNVYKLNDKSFLSYIRDKDYRSCGLRELFDNPMTGIQEYCELLPVNRPVVREIISLKSDDYLFRFIEFLLKINERYCNIKRRIKRSK